MNLRKGNKMFNLKIVDEMGFAWKFTFSDMKSLKSELNKWLKDIDETPLEKIEIGFEE
jgi:predicted RecB family nuclease